MFERHAHRLADFGRALQKLPNSIEILFSLRFSLQENRQHCRNAHVHQTQRQHELPTELHQLVVAGPADAGPHPNEKKEQNHDLNEQIDGPQPDILLSERAFPTAEEQVAIIALVEIMLIYSAMKKSANSCRRTLSETGYQLVLGLRAGQRGCGWSRPEYR